jgi:dihydrofolate reductase
MTDITIVSAMSSNYVIGHEGKIPFDLPEDRQFFREYCRNKTLVVGYQTFLGLPKMPDVSVYVLTNKKTKEAYKAYIDKVSRYHGDSPYYQFMTGTLDQFKDLLLSPST